MGALTVQSMTGGESRVIDGPRTIELPTKQGEVFVFPTKARMAAFVAAVNAEHPGAVEVMP